MAPATLRTWARRYGLGPSGHAAGAHRRYTPADIARLDAVRRLTLAGVAPAEAARAVLAGRPEVPSPPQDGRQLLPGPDGRLPAAVPPAGRRRPGGPGGRVLPLPEAGPATRGLARAAMALDGPAVTAQLREAVARAGVLAAWDDLLRPVLVAAGQRWAATGEGIEVEHLLSECAASVLRARAGEVPERPDRRPVLLAAVAADNHVLPLHALAAALAERGVATRLLGPAMPGGALAAAVRRTGPAVLFLWAQLAATADPAALEDLPHTRPPTTLLAGGPGWAATTLSRRVTVVRDLPSAVELVGVAAGA